MTNIDQLLDQLRDAPVHGRLSDLAPTVMDRLAARQQQGGTMVGPLGVAAMVALCVGIVGGIPGNGAQAAAAAVAPLGTPSPLAPSSLLVGGQ